MIAIRRVTPSRRPSTARTSSRVRTTGSRCGRFARTRSSSQGNSTPSTWRYRNNRALRAWFCVDAATLSRTASAVRNSVTSRQIHEAGPRRWTHETSKLKARGAVRGVIQAPPRFEPTTDRKMFHATLPACFSRVRFLRGVRTRTCGRDRDQSRVQLLRCVGYRPEEPARPSALMAR